MPTDSTPRPTPLVRADHRFDAADFTLGRLASAAAVLLMGKHKVSYQPHRDMGDFVTIVNATKVQLSGKKMAQKVYYRASGYAGGIRAIPVARRLATRPELILRDAVAHMLPNNRLRPNRLRRLRIVV